MYAKYRLFLQTTRRGYFMAASNTVNDLVGKVIQWLEGTSAGRSVYDDMVREVSLYELNEKTGAYERSERLPVVDRDDVVRKVRALGGR